MSEPVRFIVYSDYLCPWCHSLDARLAVLEREYGDGVAFEWRSYLLRPEEKRGRDLQKFKHYTKGWLRIAQDFEGAEFNVWQSEEGPPSHSVPAHVVAKAAARRAPEAFERVHAGLMRAYFVESRDTSDEANLRDIWAAAGLPAAEFPDLRDPERVEEVVAEHREAVESGVTGVPAVRLVDNPAVIVGAQPVELYRRWVEKTRARLAAEAGVARAEPGA